MSDLELARGDTDNLSIGAKSVFYKIFYEKLYYFVISQNLNKVTPVTVWMSEWQTENASNEDTLSI